MRSFLISLIFLIPAFGFSQKGAANTFTISKANVDKVENINDIIPSFPKNYKEISMELTYVSQNKPIVAVLNEINYFDSLKNIIKNSDAKLRVFLDARIKDSDSKLKIVSYTILVLK